MQIYFSDYFGVPARVLKKYNAFNLSLINDLPLFIDPLLLFSSAKPEYQALHERILKYLRFLKDAAVDRTLSRGLLESWYLFPEVRQNWLGYSKSGNRGSGLGRDFAVSLHKNLHEVFHDFGGETITRGSHLEKLCLIKDGIGRDNISDFSTNLIKEYLLEYTQKFARDNIPSDLRKAVSVPKARFNYDMQRWEAKTYELPYYRDDYVILTPRDILTKDDTWISRADLFHEFEDIADSIPNHQLRDQINSYFARVLPADPRKEPTREEVHGAISRVIERFPSILDYYIKYKEDHADEATATSEKKVADCEKLFIIQLVEFVELLTSATQFYQTGKNTYEETYRRVAYLKDVIENKGGHRIFYVDGKAVERESDVQILFRLTWFATPSDVGREANDGRGPVDFKISRGRGDKTLAEFKLASNTHLAKNLEKQVEIYKKASDANRAIKVIVYFSKAQLLRVQAILRKLSLEKDKDIVLIDARKDNKPSGSQA